MDWKIDILQFHKSYNVDDKLLEIKYINEILDMVSNGHTMPSIATKFGVSIPTLYKIIADNNKELKCMEEENNEQ